MKGNSASLRDVSGLILVMSLYLASAGCMPTPPGQPETGYGSSAGYICEDYTEVAVGDLGQGTGVTYFIPQVLKNTDRAPVVILLHGFSAMYVPIYQGHIEHLVRQGYIVIFPQYCLEGGLFVDLDNHVMMTRAIDAVDLVLAELGDLAETDDITLLGHSLGGLLAMCWTAEGGVPVKGIVLENPNIRNDAVPELFRDMIISIDYTTRVPAVTCPVILIGGEHDTIASMAQTTDAFDSLTNASSRVLYQIMTDAHGFPPLSADHLAPAQIGNALEDALDFRVYYAAVDAVIDGQARVAFDLGNWSDGTPVLPVETLAEAP